MTADAAVAKTAPVKTWFPRVSGPQDSEAILTLFREAIQAPIEPDVWKWKYSDNPFGPSVVWVGADLADEKKLGGQYAVIPTDLIIGGTRVPAAQSVDTMTHPNYARQGMFTELARRTYATCAERGVQVVFGFPNDNSYPGFVKSLSFRNIGNVRFLVRPSRYERLLSMRMPKILSRTLAPLLNLGTTLIYGALRATASSNNGWRAVSYDYSDPEINSRLDALAGHSEFGAHRTAAYLKWKFADRPDQKYVTTLIEKNGELMGLAVTKLRLGQINKGYIGIVVARSPSPKLFRRIVAAAERDLVKRGADIVIAAFFESSPIISTLMKMGYFRTKRIMRVIVRILDPKIELDRFVNKCEFSLGDFDTF
jgi:hypothetical protein